MRLDGDPNAPDLRAGKGPRANKVLGLIGSVREKLDALRGKGFRLKDQHYIEILRELGES